MGASALAFYRGTLVPAFAGNVFVAAGEGQYLLRLRVDARDPSKVTFNERLLSDLGSRIRSRHDDERWHGLRRDRDAACCGVGPR